MEIPTDLKDATAVDESVKVTDQECEEACAMPAEN